QRADVDGYRIWHDSSSGKSRRHAPRIGLAGHQTGIMLTASAQKGSSHGLFRSGAVWPESYDVIARRAAMVRPRAQLVVRFQPRRGNQVLPEGTGARPGMRHGALGRELRLGAELQSPLGSL